MNNEEIEPLIQCTDCRQFCDEVGLCDSCQENHTSCDVCEDDILWDDAVELSTEVTIPGIRYECSVFCESCANDCKGLIEER